MRPGMRYDSTATLRSRLRRTSFLSRDRQGAVSSRMMRNFLACLLILAAGAYAQGRRGPGRAGMPGLRILDARPGKPGPVVKGAPYTADVSNEINQTLPDGNKIHQATSERVYRDGEGRTRREAALTALSAADPGGAPQVAFIDDPVAGVSYALDLQNRTANKLPFRPPPPGNGGRGARKQQRADNPNVKTESLGRQIVAGVPADGTRTTQTIPAGQIGNTLPIQIVTERWYSPDLQTVVLEKRSDPRSGETVFQLTNIIRGEPSAALFSPPADFQVTQAGAGGRRNRQQGVVQ